MRRVTWLVGCDCRTWQEAADWLAGRLVIYGSRHVACYTAWLRSRLTTDCDGVASRHTAGHKRSLRQDRRLIPALKRTNDRPTVDGRQPAALRSAGTRLRVRHMTCVNANVDSSPSSADVRPIASFLQTTKLR